MKTIQRLRKMTPKWSTALLGASLMACGPQGLPYDENTDWSVVDFDHPDVEGIPELALPLTLATNNCSWDATNKKVTWKVGDAKTLILSLSAIDGGLYGNGTPCKSGSTGDATSTTAASALTGTPITTSDFKQIELTEDSSGQAQTVILDFINGRFGTGNNNQAGIILNLGGGTNKLRIRGTRNIDNITVGNDGIQTDTDNFVDIEGATVTNGIKGLSELTVSLLGGSDRFSAQGSTATGAAYDGTALTVYGGAGADFIDGGEGADKLYGGDDNDTIKGFTGNDTMYGDAGNDVFKEEFASGTTANGTDSFFGGDGQDTVDYSARTAAVTVDLAAGTTDGASESDHVNSGAGDANGSGIEVVKGGSANDTLTGAAAAETLYGGDGNDTLRGGDGDDSLYGEAGDDLIKEEGSAVGASSGADFISGGTGTDTVTYVNRTQDLTVDLDNIADDGAATEGDNVRSDIENITGGDGNDALTGTQYNNILTGGPGNDKLNGGAGDDTFIHGTGNDEMDGGTGYDRIDYSTANAAVWALLNGVSKSGQSGEEDILINMEDVIGEDGANKNMIIGNSSDNILTGGTVVDTILGLGGDDYFDLGGGADIINCGPGQGDLVIGGASEVDTALFKDVYAFGRVTAQVNAAGTTAVVDITFTDDELNDKVLVTFDSANTIENRLLITDSVAATKTLTVSNATLQIDADDVFVIVDPVDFGDADGTHATTTIQDNNRVADGRPAWVASQYNTGYDFCNFEINTCADITAGTTDTLTLVGTTAPNDNEYYGIFYANNGADSCEL